MHDILNYSPSLADRKALLSLDGLGHIVAEITKILKPEGSTLLTAKDILIDYGMDTPVVTDDWWLGVVEFSALDFREQHWGFPYDKNFTSYKKSKKIAWAAMQLTWQQKRKEKNISQMSKPQDVLNFIEESPGLEEICHLHPDYLAANAPQLTIRGFGAQFEDDFEKAYIESQKYCFKKNSTTDIHWGIPLGCTSMPECDLWHALRHPKFGNWKSSAVAGSYVAGSGINANVKVHSTIDYLLWLLSDQSYWLPEGLHQYLLDGFKYMNWTWYGSSPFEDDGFNKEEITGEFAYALQNALSCNEFILTEKCINDIKARIRYSKNQLQFNESIDDLYNKFIDMKFIAHRLLCN